MYFIEIAICIVFAAFFAGLETGMFSADHMGIYLKKEAGNYYARAAEFLLHKPERLLAVTLVGTNISVVTAAVLFSSYLRQKGFLWGPWAGSLFLSLVLLIFSEIIPKSFFRKYSDTISVKLAPVLVFFYFLFLPVSLILNTVVKGFLFLIGQYKSPGKLPRTRRDLRLLMRLGTRESRLGPSERRVFEDIFDFGNTLAREVMIQIHIYPVCSLKATAVEVLSIALKEEIRFIPVYRKRADNIIGFIDIEDLLTTDAECIEEIMKEALFYPDTKKIPDLLMEMNRKKLDVVFLSDEYGAVSGMITPAEIASEIIGFIPGESSRIEAQIQFLGSGHYIVSGSADIEDIQHETGIDLPNGNYDTVAGYLCMRLGEIPEKGKTFEENGVHYRILDRDDRHIKKIEIKRIPYAS